MKINPLNIFQLAMTCLSVARAPQERIHADFMHYNGTGWFANKHMRKMASWMARPDSLKIRILLNDQDLPMLNDCPFTGKIGANNDPCYPLKYCAFLYPNPENSNIGDLITWVKARSFPHASLFTYGQTNPYFLKWESGVKVATLIS